MNRGAQVAAPLRGRYVAISILGRRVRTVGWLYLPPLLHLFTFTLYKGAGGQQGSSNKTPSNKGLEGRDKLALYSTILYSFLGLAFGGDRPSLNRASGQQLIQRRCSGV